MTLDPRFLNDPIAHRGLWDDRYPENSLAAVAAAVSQGFGIELDLQLTGDGRAVMFHDETVDRMTNAKGWVTDYTAAELGNINLGNSTETIPTLASVLECVEGKVPLLIELKDQSRRPGGELGPLERAVAEDLADYDGPVAVMSFNPEMVMNLSRLLPNTPRGITGRSWDSNRLAPILTDDLNDYGMFAATESSFVSHDWNDLSMPSVHRLKDAGTPVLCWTVRNRDEETIARQVADNVTFEGYLPA